MDKFTGYLKGRHICRPLQPTRQIDLTGKPHGTHICVPYKPAGNFLLSQNSPAGWGRPALQGNKKTSRGRGGACPARNRVL